MKKTIVAALAALLASCGGEKERAISYGAPQAPGVDEQSAAANAELTLQDTALFASPGTQPGGGVAGLADQLVAALGGQIAAKLSQDGASTAVIDAGIVDPSACVYYPTPTSIQWIGCVYEDATTDPYTGATTSTMRVTVDGTFDANPATGVTQWQLHETMAETQRQNGATMAIDVTADLGGSVTVGPSTIKGGSTSTVTAHVTMPNLSSRATLQTTLGLDLRYDPDPFCVTGGSLALEQRWLERPAGSPAQDQGWRFDWTGCGLFTVAHGG